MYDTEFVGLGPDLKTLPNVYTKRDTSPLGQFIKHLSLEQLVYTELQ